MKKCAKCDTEYDDAYDGCPACVATSSDTKEKPKATAGGCLATIVLILVLFGLVSTCSSPSSTATNKPAASNAPDLVVKETDSITEDGIRYVTGTVVNNGSKQYGYVQVEVNLYDDSGAQVGSTMTNVNNLAAGGSWKFKALILEETCTKFKVKDVTGF